MSTILNGIQFDEFEGLLLKTLKKQLSVEVKSGQEDGSILIDGNLLSISITEKVVRYQFQSYSFSFEYIVGFDSLRSLVGEISNTVEELVEED